MKQCHSVAAHFPKIQKRKNSSFFFFKLRKQVVNILERSVHFQKYKFKWYPKKIIILFTNRKIPVYLNFDSKLVEAVFINNLSCV